MTSQDNACQHNLRSRIIFVASHPIQYYSPLFRAVASESDFDVQVWYCSRHGLDGSIDREFGRAIEWDLPILDGYVHQFLRNYSLRPSIYSFFGSMCLGIVWKLLISPKATLVVPGWKHFTYILAIVFGFLFGHRVVLRSEASQLSEQSKTSLKSRIRRCVLRILLLPCIDRFLAVGYQSELFYVGNGVSKQRISFSPYCVDNLRFRGMAQSLSDQKSELRKSFGLSEQATVFLFCGKLINVKRPLDLAEAFARLPVGKAELLIVGEGGLRTEMEAALENVKASVRFAGFVNQTMIPKYYTASDVLVLCSESETWGLVVNEAMNFGIPSIVSDTVGCAADLIKTNETGLVYPKGDIEKLTKCMMKYLDLPAWRWEQIHKACLQTVDVYSIQKAVDSFRTGLPTKFRPERI